MEKKGKGMGVFYEAAWRAGLDVSSVTVEARLSFVAS
jgi:hypothetical protein